MNTISFDPPSSSAWPLTILKTETSRLFELLHNAFSEKYGKSTQVLLALSGNESEKEARRLRNAAKDKSAALDCPLLELSLASNARENDSHKLLHQHLFSLACAFCGDELLATYLNLFTPVYDIDGHPFRPRHSTYYCNSRFPAMESIIAAMLGSFFETRPKMRSGFWQNLAAKIPAPDFMRQKRLLKAIWQSEQHWLWRALATRPDIYLGKTVAAFYGRKFLPFLPMSKRQGIIDGESGFLRLSKPGKYAEACQSGLRMGAKLSPEALLILADNFFQLFNFQCAALCALIGARLHPAWKNGQFLFLAGRYLMLAGESGEALAKFCQHVGNNRNGLVNFDRFRISERLNRHVCAADWNQAFAIFRLRLGNLAGLPQARLLCHAGQSHEAEKLLEAKCDRHSRNLLADIYLKNGSYRKAEKLVLAMTEPESKTEKLLELRMRKRRRDKVIETLDAIKQKNFSARQNSLHVLANFYADDMAGAFRQLAKPDRINILTRYFPEKIISAPVKDGRQTAIVADCFIGDETRYGRLYPSLAKLFDPCIIICNEKLHPLLKRSYPEIRFFPSRKLREAEFCDDFSPFTELPGLECSFYLDNRAFRMLKETPHVIPLLKALPFAGADREIWRNLPVYKASAQRVAFYKNYFSEFAAGRNLRHIAGISWRSSISDRIRDINRFQETLLRKLLSLKDILFINCQYDGLSINEQAFFRQHENFLPMQEIDQFNDIGETAAMYSALDMMISSNTFSGDLAASLGKTVLMPVKDPMTLAFCGSDYPRHLQESTMLMFYYRNDADFPKFEREIRTCFKKRIHGI